jgi:cytochrome c oxidase subunit II
VRPLPRSRSAWRPLRWLLVGAIAAGALTGCSATTERGFLPKGITTESDRITNLWVGAWIAALVVGVLVWGLTIWCIAAYRKRKDDVNLPEQLRYHLPLEILYTVIPIMMIGVLFFYTARDESAMMDTSAKPDQIVNVVGKQWAWDFNYVTQDVYESSVPVVLTGDAKDAEKLPTLYLPVGERVEFVLTARDVIHSFWVPAFLRKLDMLPGRVNKFQVTPTTEGTFMGKCAELCGTYHSQMLFQVKVVPKAEFEQHVADLKAKGNVGQLPNTLDRQPLVPEDQDKVPTPGSNA